MHCFNGRVHISLLQQHGAAKSLWLQVLFHWPAYLSEVNSLACSHLLVLILADIQFNMLSILLIISKERKEQRCPVTNHISPRRLQVIHFIDSGPRVDKCLPQHYFRHSDSNGKVHSLLQKYIKFLILYFNQAIFFDLYHIQVPPPPQYYYEINN